MPSGSDISRHVWPEIAISWLSMSMKGDHHYSPCLVQDILLSSSAILLLDSPSLLSVAPSHFLVDHMVADMEVNIVAPRLLISNKTYILI